MFNFQIDSKTSWEQNTEVLHRGFDLLDTFYFIFIFAVQYMKLKFDY